MLNAASNLEPWYLETVSGTVVPKIEDYLGTPLLILFFNLHCPGCVARAIPFANRMTLENEGKLNVIGIHSTFEGPELSDKDIVVKMEELYARFPFYRDAGLAATFYSYQAAGTPHWILADTTGRIVQNIFGSDPNRALLRLDLSLKELMTI